MSDYYGEEEGQAATAAVVPSPPPGLTKAKVPPPKRAPAPAPAAVADTPARLEQLERALLEFLAPKPNGKEHLPKVGVFVRSRNLAPAMGLKRFILSRSDMFAYIELENGTNLVQLASRRGAPPPAPGLPAKPAPKTLNPKFSPVARPEVAAPANGRSPAVPAAVSAADAADAGDIDEAGMERLLVSHILSHPAGAPAVNCPSLGELCLRQGISMKGRLAPFLRARPHLFHIPDDGRQQVLLVPGAAAALGLGAEGTAAAQRAGSLPSLPDDLGLAELRATPNGGAAPAPPASAAQQRRVPVPLDVPSKPAAAAAGNYRQAAGDYARWDPLTQELFRYVRSRGGATFSDIDAHIKGQCAALVVPSGLPLQAWKAAVFLKKRASIFNVQGPLVTVAPHAINADAGAERSSPGNAAERLKAPTPKTALPVVRPAHHPSPGQQRQASAAAAGATAASEAFPPLPGSKAASSAAGGTDPGSLAAERRALEEIRDDIQGRLTSFRALSELQKENAGLRAACVTLGRELLSLKDEFAALRRQLAASLGPAFGPTPASPDLADSLSSLDLGVPAGSADASFLPHLAAAPGAAAAVGDEIVLVGGHDGVSWLDAVDTFSPATGAWRSLPALDRPRSFCVAVSSPDAIYVAGGGNGTDWYTSAMRLDRSAAAAGGGAWQQLAPLAVARGSMAASFASGRLYVYGGGKPGEQYGAVEWYDPHADSWHRGPELAERRFALAGATLGGALYAVGGYDGARYLSSVERLDPREGKWAPVAAMAGQRGGHACVAAGGLLYALGGYSSTAVQECEAFDPRTGGWTRIPALLDCRAYGGAAAVGGEVFAVGGLRADMQTHSGLLERYSPGGGGWGNVELPANANPRRSFLATCTLEHA